MVRPGDLSLVLLVIGVPCVQLAIAACSKEYVVVGDPVEFIYCKCVCLFFRLHLIAMALEREAGKPIGLVKRFNIASAFEGSNSESPTAFV